VSRPAISVVMPFAGPRAAAAAALDLLAALHTRVGDELLFVDNARAPVPDAPEVVTVIRAVAEHSPAYARNAGAERAGNEWILFLDADTRAPADLLDAYFAAGAPSDDVGALAGEVVASGAATSIAERYGAARGFLSQAAHLAHPYRPRAVAANLLVRRTAFWQVGGFYEGVRAAEDTDFSWRLQQAGWGLELRPGARVEHVYRSTVRDLRRQWRGYAAGRAWLGRRYEGFTPEPALRRVFRGQGRRSGVATASEISTDSPAHPSRFERARHLVLDGVLAVEELIGFLLSNQPRRRRASGGVLVVLVADRFPAQDDPLVEFARALDGVRIEAASRPSRLSPEAARALRIDYREDDGTAARVVAMARLAARHPVRTTRALRSGESGLTGLAPAALRLTHDRHARLQALGGGEAERTATALARLSGHSLGEGGAA
jgi:GT2 family glycosyltransferase